MLGLNKFILKLSTILRYFTFSNVYSLLILLLFNKFILSECRLIASTSNSHCSRSPLLELFTVGEKVKCSNDRQQKRAHFLSMFVSLLLLCFFAMFFFLFKLEIYFLFWSFRIEKSLKQFSKHEKGGKGIQTKVLQSSL